MQVHKTNIVYICISAAVVPWCNICILFCSLIYVDNLLLFLTIFIFYKRNARQLTLCWCVTHALAHCSITKAYYRDITSALFSKLINVDILLLFLTILIYYKAEIDTLLMRYTHVPFQVYLSMINFIDIYSISYQSIGFRVVRAVDLKSGGLEMLVVQILQWTWFFVMFTCSVLLAAGLAAFKWNQAWHSSEVIGA